VVNDSHILSEGKKIRNEDARPDAKTLKMLLPRLKKITTAGRLYSTCAEFPVIDMRPILTPSHPDRPFSLNEIGIALQHRGFFYMSHVDVLPKNYINSVYDYLHRLHELPSEIKQRYAQRDGHGAYSGLDIGQAELAYDPKTVATVRAWDYSRTRFTLKKTDDPESNRYPGTEVITPDYTTFVDDLYSRQDVLGQALMTAFAESLGLKPNTFVDMFKSKDGDGDFGTIRLLSYPKVSSDDAMLANVGISAHTDFEAFTLMHQDAPGLQFIPASSAGADAADAGEKDNDSSREEWIDAPVREGEFVVIVGDVLERFTNGVLKATPHRVVTTPHRRASIIRFNAVTADTVIAPLPSFVSETNPSKYTTVTMKTHMETTMQNLDKGIGAWDDDAQRSLTANYEYVNGKDWRDQVEVPVVKHV